MTEPARIFDRTLLRYRRAAAAARIAGEAGFLHREVAARLLDRLGDINRDFELAIALGWDAKETPPPARHVIYGDLASARAAMTPGPALAVDEEALPFRDDAADLILSNLTLHWVNDLPGALIQINRALRPDGLFLGAMLGGETLIELRRALMQAEEEISGGAHLRVSPMAGLQDLAGLMQRAGFAMPVADCERITVSYADPFKMLRELQAMGETNAALERQKSCTRSRVLLRAIELYAHRHADAERRIPATFDVMMLAGWAPGPGQPRPKRPGSATARLADALGAQEVQLPGSR